MEVLAKARFIRMSPRKVRLVIDVVRGMSVAEACMQLKFMKKLAAEPVLKLVNSAVANATNNHGLIEKGLRIKSIVADGGPIMYRYRPRAMGRSAPIRKRTCHITVVLEGELAPVKKKPVKDLEKKKEEKAEKQEEKNQEAKSIKSQTLKAKEKTNIESQKTKETN